MSWRIVLVSAAMTIFTSCAGMGGERWVELETPSPDPGSVERITGTVHHLDVEGGLFVIRDAEGTQYDGKGPSSFIFAVAPRHGKINDYDPNSLSSLRSSAPPEPQRYTIHYT